MRILISLLLCFCFILGCGDSEKKEKKNPARDGSDQQVNFLDNKPVKPPKKEDDEVQLAKQKVDEFYQALKKQDFTKAKDCIASEGQDVFRNRPFPSVKNYYILGATQKDEYIYVETAVDLFYSNGQIKRWLLTWLVKKDGLGYYLYGVKTKDLQSIFSKHNPKEWEEAAIKILKIIREKGFLYRLRHGRYPTSMADFVKAKFFKKKIQNGKYKGYQFILTPKDIALEAYAIPLLPFPSHKAFYLDKMNVLRYNLDGSMPNQTSKAYTVKKKRKKRRK